MKILTLSAIALIGAALISGQAVGANYGTLILKAGETQTVAIGPTGRNMRVCNDFFSSGPVAATIGGNLPRDLSPGVCAEDIGDRVTVQSHAGGLATVAFKSICDGSEMSR
jgi:hypothetical protein